MHGTLSTCSPDLKGAQVEGCVSSEFYQTPTLLHSVTDVFSDIDQARLGS